MGNSWVDYANLGLNVANAGMNAAQLQALNETSTQLAQLSQIEANRERRHKLETSLRQFAFEQEAKLTELIALPNASPAEKWFGATIIKHNVEGVHLSAASFEAYVDKDRVTAFLTKLTQTIDANERLLSSDQLMDLKMADKIILERQDLAGYTKFVAAQEYVDQTEAEWERLQKESRYPAWGWIAPLALIIGPFFMAGVAGPIPSVIGFVLALVIVVAADRSRYTKAIEFKELTQKREVVRQQQTPEIMRLRAMTDTFGRDRTSSQLLAEQERRERMLEAIFAKM